MYTYIYTHIVHWYHVTYNTIYATRTIISINQAPIINNASSGATLAPVDLSNKVTRTECKIKSPLFSLYYLIVYIRDKLARALFLSFSLSRLTDYIVVLHVQWALNSRSRVRQKHFASPTTLEKNEIYSDISGSRY